MLWGNTAYCIQLSCEDLARYSNKTESLGLRKCPYYHYFIEKVIYLSIYLSILWAGVQPTLDPYAEAFL